MVMEGMLRSFDDYKRAKKNCAPASWKPVNAAELLIMGQAVTGRRFLVV